MHTLRIVDLSENAFIFHIYSIKCFSAFNTSDLDNLIVPIDDRGRRCGKEFFVQDNVSGLYIDLLKCARFSALFYGCPTMTICVSNCPEKKFVFDSVDCDSNRAYYEKNIMCGHHTTKPTTCKRMKELIEIGNCTSFYLPSEPSKSSIL